MDNSSHINGLISCIIPVYNREKLVLECIQSVLNQKYNNYEIIVVDDGSTDQTPQVLTKLANNHPNKIRILQQQNRGPGAARQYGLDHAQGEFIQFLDSDDLILPTKFESFIRAFNQPPWPDIVYAITHYYSAEAPEDYFVWKKTNQNLEKMLPLFFVYRPWGTATPIYRHSILLKAGKILPLYCEEDLEYECRIGLQHPKLHYIDQHLTDIRHHQGDRFSINNANRAKQLSNQIQARKHIHNTMCEFGLKDNSEEMRLFAQTMFLLARQAGELNLKKESRAALDLAMKAGGELSMKDKIAMNVFKLTNRIAGQQRGSLLFSGIYNRLYKIKKSQSD